MTSEFGAFWANLNNLKSIGLNQFSIVTNKEKGRKKNPFQIYWLLSLMLSSKSYMYIPSTINTDITIWPGPDCLLSSFFSAFIGFGIYITLAQPSIVWLILFFFVGKNPIDNVCHLWHPLGLHQLSSLHTNSLQLWRLLGFKISYLNPRLFY